LVDRKIVEYLLAGKSRRWIQTQLSVGGGRFEKVKALATQHGYLSGATPLPEYPQRLFPDRIDRRAERRSDIDAQLSAHQAWIEDRLRAGWHAITVFEELPISVTRSSFYRFLDRHGLGEITGATAGVRVVPEIVHTPGEALILDWGLLARVFDPARQALRALWVLIGVFGFSRYLMARLVWSNDVPTTLAAIATMLSEAGGVPTRVTSDNPKCFCLHASRYEPLLNPAFERFAAHYGFLIECLPPADAQKKGKVERMVPYLRRLYEAHGAFVSLQQSQHYLDAKLALANQRTHGTTRRRPVDDLTVERQHLRPLPATAYELEQTAIATVRHDGHVRFANRYYSLDERYVGAEVFILASATRVAIYHRGVLVESHARLTDPYRVKQTKPEHLKPWEQALSEHSMYRERARKLGPAVEALVVALLEQGRGFIDTRKIWGILSLDKQHRAHAIDTACRQAIDMHSYSYRSVVRLLKHTSHAGADPTPAVAPTPRHKFTRDLAVYAAQLPLPFIHSAKENTEP
jgi:hypothetical protein